MVHGNPTWSFLWRHLIQGLPEYRSIAIDHVGCGRSERPKDVAYCLRTHESNLVRLIDELDLRDATLLAHDWGGPIGLRAVLQRRERFSRVILFNTGGFPPPFIPWRIRACRIPLIGRLGVQGLNLFAKAAQSMAVADRNSLSQADRDGLISPYDSWENRHAIYQFVRDIPSSPSHPTWKDLVELEAALPELSALPIKLIWGMRDWCFRPSCLERFITHWPTADVSRLDVGHWVTEEAREDVVRLVREFLLRTDA
jgi:haloalkane dehalogenase